MKVEWPCRGPHFVCSKEPDCRWLKAMNKKQQIKLDEQAEKLFWAYLDAVELYLQSKGVLYTAETEKLARRIEEQIDITVQQADDWRRSIAAWYGNIRYKNGGTIPGNLTWESNPKLKLAIMRFLCIEPNWLNWLGLTGRYRSIDDPWEPCRE